MAAVANTQRALAAAAAARGPRSDVHIFASSPPSSENSRFGVDSRTSDSSTPAREITYYKDIVKGRDEGGTGGVEKEIGWRYGGGLKAEGWKGDVIFGEEGAICVHPPCFDEETDSSATMSGVISLWSAHQAKLGTCRSWQADEVDYVVM